MNRQESIEQAVYLQELADRSVSISRNFNTEVGRRFGKFKRGNIVYFHEKKRRVYFTVMDARFSPKHSTFLYDLSPIDPPANVRDKDDVREEELTRYFYNI